MPSSRPARHSSRRGAVQLHLKGGDILEQYRGSCLACCLEGELYDERVLLCSAVGAKGRIVGRFLRVVKMSDIA